MLHVFVSAADDEIRPGATGRAVPGYRRHRAGRRRQPGARRRPGRLAVKGPTGCRYLADPRQKVYVQNGWNITGDTYVPRRRRVLLVPARSDDMIISSGYNIGGPEVEQALDQHPDVVECAVVGRAGRRPRAARHAVVVLREGVAGDAAKVAELQDFVKRRIAPYKYPRVDRVRAPSCRAPRPARCSGTGCASRSPPPEGPAMRIAVIGGGPGGLYFAALTKALGPESEIRVWERNAPDDTFGFGVVFTDETLGGIEHADPVIHARMAERFARWDDIDVHFRGTVITSAARVSPR